MHRDLKPTNISLIKKLRFILLNIGTLWHLKGSRTLQPELGQVGTVSYLAPKLELDNYNYSIDI